MNLKLKKFCKRALCLTLCVVMIASLAACKKKNKNTNTIDKNTIYSEEALNIAFPENFSVNTFDIVGNKLAFYGNTWDEITHETKYLCGSVNVDGSDFNMFEIKLPKYEMPEGAYGPIDDMPTPYVAEEGLEEAFAEALDESQPVEDLEIGSEDELPAEEGEDLWADEDVYASSDMLINPYVPYYGGAWIDRVIPLKSGDFVAFINESVPDDIYAEGYNYINRYSAKLLDEKGNEKKTESLSDKYNIEYINDFIATDDGGLLLSYGTGFLFLDKDINVVSQKDSNGDTYYNFMKLKDGSLAVSFWMDGKTEFHRFDLNRLETGEAISFPDNVSNMSVMDGSGNYDILLYDSVQLYGANVGDTEITPIMNFVNSDLSTQYFTSIGFTSDGVLVGSYNDWDSETSSFKVCKYTKVDPSTIVDKQVLTIGCLWLNSEIRKDVIAFNKSNNEYRITIKDYSSYDSQEDWDAGSKKFNSDIASGQSPDIIIANDASMIMNYAPKGLFVDLNKYLDEDPDIDKSDIFPNLLEACSYKGKLCAITPSFYISTVIGKTSALGGRKSWTFEEFKNFEKTLPEGTTLFNELTRENLLNSMLNINVGDYIDAQAGKCYFDSPEFIDLITYVKNLPTWEDLYTDEYWEDYDYTSAETAFRENRAILQMYTLYSLSDYKYSLRGTFGEDLSFVGYPCKEGTGSALFINSCYAISSKSANPDMAWDFIKKYVSSDYQSKISWGLPASMTQFDKLGKEAMEKPYWMDGNEKVEYDDTYYLNGQEIIMDPLTADEVKTVKDFILSVNKISSYQTGLEEIIAEDTEPFFAGEKTAEEVVKIIQSRASIYLNERQ